MCRPYKKRLSGTYIFLDDTGFLVKYLTPQLLQITIAVLTPVELR